LPSAPPCPLPASPTRRSSDLLLFQQGLDLAGGDIGQGDFVAELLSGGGGLRHLNLRGSFTPADRSLRQAWPPTARARRHRRVGLDRKSTRLELQSRFDLVCRL